MDIFALAGPYNSMIPLQLYREIPHRRGEGVEVTLPTLP
jgi:hypothetical protein